MSQKRQKAQRQKDNQKQRLSSPEEGGGSALAPSWRFDLFCWLGGFAVVALLYGHTLHAPWYLDDVPNIVDNEHIRSLSAAWDSFFRARGPAVFSFAVNYRIGELSLPVFHVTNIAIHALAAGFVYLIAKRVFPGRRWLPVLVAAIFLAHPLQTQAVTYIVQRMASLAALFGFLSLYLFIRARECLAEGVRFLAWRHLRWWLGSLLACLLAVYTKQNLAILPLSLLLFDHFYLARPQERPWGVTQRLCYLAVFFLPPVILTLQELLIPLSAGTSLQDIASTQAKITPLAYLVTEFSVIWLYIKLLVVPYPLLLDYVYPVVTQLFSLKSLLAFVGLVVLVVMAFMARRRLPHLSFGILWFLLGLAVESTLIPLDPVFEHRVYYSMFGFAVLFVGGGASLLKEKVFLPVCLGCLLVLGGLTWQRNQVWNDRLGLYMENLKHIKPDDGFVKSLTKYMLENKLYPEATEILSERIEKGSINPGIYINAVIAYRFNGEPAKGIAVVEQAARMGIANQDLDIEMARAQRLVGDYEKSAEAYRVALDRINRRGRGEVDRDVDVINKELGLTLAAMGRTAEAEPYLRAALEKTPGSAPLRLILSQMLVKRGALDEAETMLRFVLTAEPDNKNAWYSLGLLADKADDAATLKEAHARLEVLDKALADKLAVRLQARRL